MVVDVIFFFDTIYGKTLKLQLKLQLNIKNKNFIVTTFTITLLLSPINFISKYNISIVNMNFTRIY